ncbi:MAG: dihydrofolate reductase [Puniceicoccales bacterium]|nr:dihydrofolate reductase [Puniceicoccales bacterium]
MPKLFLAGGAALYAEALPWCEELLLTYVAASPAGDALFPEFAPLFDAGEVLETHAESVPAFEIRRHRRRAV